MRVVSMLLLSAAAFAGDGWWMREPVRLIQTNLRETDAALDPARLIGQLADFRANTLLFGMGGITAYYPTRVALHYASPYLPAGRDTFGELLRLAHARGIRVIGRFDLSKTQKRVYDAHPEWFFRRANGDPVIYNGLYSVCINGGYYREKGMEILAEALERYDVDGLFFNMFGNQSTDYSGRPVGLCHCDNCRRIFRERFHRELPETLDADYQLFMFQSSREVGAAIGKLIHSKRPNAGFFTYIQEFTDGIMSESNTAVNRPLPLWPYASSDNVNRARNSQPGKAAVNLCMSFVDYPWRFATVPQNEIRIRLWQNVAHGGALAMNMHGTMDQQDRHALEAARPIYRWLADHEKYYAGQESAARVLLLGRSATTRANDRAYRGFFRLLSEEHIPFAVADNLEWIGKREFDLVIAAGWVPRELTTYKGKLLIATPDAPPVDVGKPVKRWTGVQGYLRVRDRANLPSLRDTDLIMLNGDFMEYEPEGRAALTLVPPSMFGPPEKVHVDQVDTDKPGLIVRGNIAYLPWDAGALYYQHSLQAHHELLRDLIDMLLPRGRQLQTNAHPLVEMALMRQGGRHILHLVNLSGHSQTAYFDAVPMQGISVRVAGGFTRAQALMGDHAIPVKHAGGYTELTLPRLAQYEAIVLE